jgi:predicted exporter
MTVFILSGLFIGGLIGARRTVLALLPAAACALGMAATVSILHPGAHDWTALHVTALLLFLQVGYLCGAGLRMFGWPPGIIRERKRLRSS